MKQTKEKRIKRIVYVLAALTLLVATTTWIGLKVSVAAEDIRSLKISKEGVASWQSYKGAEKYSYSCSTFGGEVRDTSLDLKSLLASNGKKSGTYMLMLRAIDSEGHPLTDYASIAYQYVSKNDLKTPQNLKWKETIASWDLVKGADYYEVYLFRDNGILACMSTTKDNSYDFSSNASALKGESYYFKVIAKTNNGGGTSGFSANSAMQKGWYELVDLNAEISKENVLIWNPVEGAESYQWFINGEYGNHVSGEGTRVDLSGFLKGVGASKGKYQVSLFALGGKDSNYSAVSKEWKGSFSFDPTIVTYKETLYKELQDASLQEVVLREDVELNDEDLLFVMQVDKIDRSIDLNGHTLYNKKTIEGTRGCGIVILYTDDNRTVTIKDSKGTGKAMTNTNVLFGISNVKNYNSKKMLSTWTDSQLMISGRNV